MTDTVLTVKLSRDQIQPWGFRLQGGKDFNSPLILQKVTSGSLAEKAGLQPGDVIFKINGVVTENMKHKEAQDALVQAGNQFEITVQRGDTRVWKPTVTNIIPPENGVMSNDGPIVPLTKTSLTANPQEVRNVGSNHNLMPKPFGQQNGDQKVPAFAPKQYNSPVPLYSKQNIAQTLATQAEVLPTGAVGNNFMKNVPPVNLDSAVYRMVLEDQNTPSENLETSSVIEVSHPKSQPLTHDIPSKFFKALQKSLNEKEEPLPLATVLHHLDPPKPIDHNDLSADSNKNLCFECGRLIVGIFVRIKDKNIHEDCFKCATCGSSLRNTGYFNVKDKLYCEVHARLMAKNPQTSANGSIALPVSSTLPNKEIQTVGISFQGPSSSTSFNPSAINTIKLSTATPISNNNVNARHLQSNNDVHKQFTVSTPLVAATYCLTLSGLGLALSASPKPFSSLTVSAKPVVAPLSPRNNRTHSSTWSTATPTGAPTKPMHTSPTIGSRLTPNHGGATLNTVSAPGTRTPVCAACEAPIKGPFVNALGKTWCHHHFRCANAQCQKPLQDIGFVEEQGQLYCEICYEAYLAPVCSKCSTRVKGNCLNAIDKQWHPDCFVCSHCHAPFGSSNFYLEDGLPYCEKDWNQLFTTKCAGCGFSIEAGDRWIEALKNSYHSKCFRCTMCLKSLDGESFYAKGGRPFCKNHA